MVSPQHIVISIFFLHCSLALLIPERDVDTLIYSGSQQPENRQSDIEAERRSVLNKNFYRFGRSDQHREAANQEAGDYEYDGDEDAMARPVLRSGKERNDNFIRFGRTNSNFLRFGREGGKGSGFVRFGREPYEPWPGYQKRSRRSAALYEDAKKNASNFLRFGKDGFLRFGRPEGPDYRSTPKQDFLDFFRKLRQIRNEGLMAKIKQRAD